MFQNSMDLSLLDGLTIQTSASLSTYKATAQKEYNEVLKYGNVTSFSQLDTFNRCPRKFQLIKERAAFNPTRVRPSNGDFAFGHAVGSGIQNYLMTGDLTKALLNCVLAWDIEFTDGIAKSGKFIWSAMIAVEKFAAVVLPSQLDEWELLVLPGGKPAIEVGFSFHCGNGFKHYCHLDIGLRHKRSRRIMIVDCKTTGFSDAEPALYANSSQALSYAIMVQTALPEEVIDYDVMYLVWSSKEREWTPLTFTKSALDQAEFIKDLLITQDLITTYDSTGFYPKRGNACYEYFRRCEFFGECNLTADGKLPILPDEKEAEKPDYVVDLAEVIKQLKEKRHESK